MKKVFFIIFAAIALSGCNTAQQNQQQLDAVVFIAEMVSAINNQAAEGGKKAQRTVQMCAGDFEAVSISVSDVDANCYMKIEGYTSSHHNFNEGEDLHYVYKNFTSSKVHQYLNM